ncbi:alpha/beta hydrolase [Aestuariibaculum sp. YM273]|uniref:alpha/beta hydrolase family protein n=1 Tax=Aestuariibaculum sp. YM273 TaxID=3070659 RepID=UPI0027DD6C43|nr:alpha/beta hydrolase [Aestuariibaculum sp. YM273]WMI64783.1 alpha/beta hydrolase [Aestuariibaculum sp. YM273]
MKKLVALAIISFLWNQNIIAQNIGDNSQNLIEVELIIQADKIKIGGTLALPETFKMSSLVIMSSGSGPQDRDETLEGFKIFKVIAEHLASKGIASFRYDDRGVGASTGDFVNSTLDDHSKDLQGIMDYFKTTKGHSFSSFILFGHSQGGILAAKVAVANESVKKVVLMAVPSVPLIEVVTYQVRQEYKGLEIPKSLIEADVSAHNKLMRAIEDDKKIDEAYNLFRKTTESILYKMSLDLEVDALQIEQKATDKANEYKIIYGLPSLASFLYYDPFKDLEQLNVPVLSLFGGLDFQVPIDQNKDRMENALLKSGTQYELKTFNNANHYFQVAGTGKREEYATIEKSFTSNFLNQISEWILHF